MMERLRSNARLGTAFAFERTFSRTGTSGWERCCFTGGVGRRRGAAPGCGLVVMDRNRDRSADTRYEKELAIMVDPVKARFGAWYEMFPRSCTTDAKRHGTFRDCIDRLPYIAGMGFDVLYLPPIHPIGVSERKGK